MSLSSNLSDSHPSHSASISTHYNEGVELDNRDGNHSRGSVSALTKAEKQHGNSMAIESKRRWGVRHTLCLLLWSGSCASFLSRVSLSMAIVSMVGSSSTTSNGTEVCPPPSRINSTSEDTNEGEFDWDEQTQGILLGSFYYGYLVSNFVGALVTEYVGGRWMMTITVLGSSVLSLLSPICARSSVGLFIAVRVLSGITQGPLVSATFSLMATWIPPQEKAMMCSLTFTGSAVGTVLSMALGGVLIGSDFLGGWPSVFYVFGAFGVLWTIPWVLLIHDRPEDHPSVSAAELSFIKANESTLKRAKRVKVPWVKIATSVPFWCLVAVSWGNNFGFFNLLTEIPTYLENIQHYGIENNGLLSALPYIISIIVSITWGIVANHLVRTKRLSVIQVRKLSSAIAMFGPAIGLVAMCFVDCNSTLAIVCLCFSVGINTTSNSGGDISEQEIAPNLAAEVKGLTNTVGSLAGIVAPLITGTITSGNQTLSAWRTVFSISALTYCVCCIIYLIFGTSNVQPWNEPKEKKDINRY